MLEDVCVVKIDSDFECLVFVFLVLRYRCESACTL